MATLNGHLRGVMMKIHHIHQSTVCLTLTVLVTTTDALQHFETG